MTCGNPRCLGAFVDVMTSRLVRCDECKKFSDDDHAVTWANRLLQDDDVAVVTKKGMRQFTAACLWVGIAIGWVSVLVGKIVIWWWRTHG